ncbi:IS3 family transposase [Streptomyces canus]|uniref:IS3 family transposase n=1 Tax=Streptomyces canus TaxID=58343 RepID=UPI0033C5A980
MPVWGSHARRPQTRGLHVGRKRVERLMREADIVGISPRLGASRAATPGPPSPRT